MIKVADRFEGVNLMQRELRKQKARILRDLRNLIFSLPENPHIKVISQRPRCFIMSSAHLSSRDWTPAYYNFDKQYRAICREIRKMPFEKVIPFLKETLKEGVLKKLELYFDGTSGKRRVNIHPLVVENIQNIL